MKDLSSLTSLERYVRTRGQQFVAGSPSFKNYVLQLRIGSGLLAVGIGLLVIADLTKPEIGFAAIGPLIAGFVNVAVSLALKKRFPQTPAAEIQATAEARAMLSALSWNYVWSKNPWVWNPHTQWDPSGYAQHAAYGRPHQHGGHSGRHGRWGMSSHQEALDSLPDEILLQMEQAAFQYNRIAGVVETGASGGNVLRLAPKISLGADEAMLDVLHQAQLISRFPEGVTAIKSRLSSGVSTLQELADRVETLALREPTFTEILSRRSTADEVLEELRLEQAAFSELSAPPQDQQHLQG